MRILLLGGTSEATAAARLLAAGDADALLSLAGRTSNPAPSPLRTRVGGFGGAAGLAEFLAAERIGAVLDATHPFAAQISRNAVVACASAGVPLAVLTRPGWREGPGDAWARVATMEDAVDALGTAPRTVFLTIGRQQAGVFARAPQHRYLLRSIETAAAGLPHCRVLLARPPFTLEDEMRLMADEGVDVLVTKDSGASASRDKLDAARELGLPVVMVDRPPPSGARAFVEAEAALAYLAAHAGTPRGV